jgi:peptidoglycan/LPS O-acetylase OafA/YrhL
VRPAVPARRDLGTHPSGARPLYHRPVTTTLDLETPPVAQPTSAAPAPSSAHRIEYVDGLRAVAVLAVVLHHVSRNVGVSPDAARFLNEGAHGVDLFFVLSGFCLAFPTLAKLRRTGAATFDVADFGAKRLVRILPPFYLATFAIVALYALPRLLRHQPLPAHMPTAWDLAASLLFIDGGVNLVNGAFWTLMVEFRWYFAFPLLLALWVRSPRAFGAVALASFVLYNYTRAHALDLGTLPGFMLGIVAADLQLGGSATRSWAAHAKRWALPLAAVCAALGVAVESTAKIPGFDGNDVVFAYQPTILGWQLAVFFLVVAAGALAPLRRALGVKALVATGVASYGIYLVHEPAIEFAVSRLHGVLAFPAGIAAGVGVGFAFWALADRPFMTEPLRRPLVAAISPLLARAGELLRLGRRMTLREAPVEEAAPVEARA